MLYDIITQMVYLTMPKRHDRNEKSRPGYDIVIHEKSETNLNA